MGCGSGAAICVKECVFLVLFSYLSPFVSLSLLVVIRICFFVVFAALMDFCFLITSHDGKYLEAGKLRLEKIELN